MAEKSRSALKTYNNNNIDTNGSNAITGSIHNTMNDDLIDSCYNKVTDIALVGVKEFSATRSYVSGEGVNYNGVYYIANTNNGPGAFNSTQWDETQLKKDEFNFNTTNILTYWTNVSGSIYRRTHNLNTWTPKFVMRDPSGEILDFKDVELKSIDVNTIQCNFGFGLTVGNDYYVKIEK